VGRKKRTNQSWGKKSGGQGKSRAGGCEGDGEKCTRQAEGKEKTSHDNSCSVTFKFKGEEGADASDALIIFSGQERGGKVPLGDLRKGGRHKLSKKGSWGLISE